MKSAAQINKYDEVPYTSYPYAQSSPGNLYTIAKLFGIDAKNPKSARVLELGCASGGNVIPFAFNNPGASCVGVDLSQEQIDQGCEQVNDLGLENITLKHLSIMDVNKDFGEFDYIIVHGILSWVPQEVQEKIFHICRHNLSENGIAYISYNTLPGWTFVKSIRDMMLYHTKNFSNPAEKAKQARMLLNFIKEGTGDADTPHAKFIQSEINLLKDVGDDYLMHDHLEDENHSFYFHEFVEKLRENDLHYLSDVALSTMFLGNFPEGIESVLKKVSHDIVRSEQYMDFIRNRRFRASLVCQGKGSINRDLKYQALKDFAFATSLVCEKDYKDVDSISSEPLVFKSGEIKFTTDKSIVAEALFLCREDAFANVFVDFDTIFNQSVKRLEKKGVKFDQELTDAAEKTLLMVLLRLVLLGVVQIRAEKTSCVTSVSNKPKVSELAIYQSKQSDWVTNQQHSKVVLDTFSRVMMQYLDGKNDIKSINQKMLVHVEKGDIVIKNKDQSVTDLKERQRHVAAFVDNILRSYARNALLIA